MAKRGFRSAIYAMAGIAALGGFGWALTHWSAVQVSLVSFASTAPATAAAKPVPIPVSIVVAIEGDIERVIAGIGTVASLATVTVRTQVDGEVTSMPFTEGDAVPAGDVLVQIDPVQLQTALVSAQSKETQDASLLENARTDSKRYALLAKQDSVSAEILDQKVAAVQQAHAVVESDQAAVTGAKAKLEFATIRAPISGRTGFRQIDPGNVVSASAATAIVTITQLDPIAVVFVAPGDRFAEIRQAMKDGVATVSALSTDGRKVLARGKLTLMDNNVDSTNGSVKLRASFDNKQEVLWPGLPVATRLTTAVRHGVIVPDAVLTRGVDGLYAYVVDDGGLTHRRAVEAGLVTDGMALVSNGIAIGDKIVSQGRDQVGEGTQIAISAAPAKEAISAPAADSGARAKIAAP